MSDLRAPRRVFSLVEMLYVIAILAVVAAVLFPVMARARTTAGGSMSSAVHATALANAMYSMDYQGNELAPNGVQWNKVNYHAGGGGGSQPILYHGGPLMLGTPNVYYIWYGNWSGNSATTILTDLISGMGGSTYYAINATYYNGSNVHISNAINYSGSTTDNYSRGTSLSDSAIQGVVADAINSGRLPKDSNGVYFVLTSADVTATSGFCTQYCGWHTYSTISGSNIKYAFVGNPDRCPPACSMGQAPNGNAGADGMASIISHELEEATSDPNLNAWFDRRGAENADKCAWTFGNVQGSPGAQWNVTIGSRNFLIQRNWNAASQRCERVITSPN